MRQLTEDLTDEIHITDAETMWYTEVQREFMGRKLTIEVEVYLVFDGAPAEIRYYGRVPFTQTIGEGFAVMEDSFLMLSNAEMQDLLDSPEAQDYLQAEAEASDDERHNRMDAEREFIGDARARGWAK